MMVKTAAALLMVGLLAGCAASARKAAQWQKVHNGADIVCSVGTNTSGMLFVSRLGEKRSRTNLAPDSLMVTDAASRSKDTFLVRKRLRRYVQSAGDFNTLAALEVTVGFAKRGHALILTPTKKKEYQVSVIGKWPIPKMDVNELANFLGKQCEVMK